MQGHTYLPVASPSLRGNENRYVQDCLDTGWISSGGAYVSRFETAFADIVGVDHAVSCVNGTAALHLALLALGVSSGDEVIVPSLTYIATANAVTYCGANPVFVDSDPESWNLDPSRIEALIGPNTRGIIAVHLYGQPADMEPILNIAKRHNLFVLEDAAEAHGATYHGKPVGSLGDATAFSFFGNKTITTGEGGMITTNRRDLDERMRQLRNQGQDPEQRYWFPIVGFNYRMTNIAAAIGLAQVEQLDQLLAERETLAALYDGYLAQVPYIEKKSVQSGVRPTCWLYSIVFTENCPVTRDHVMKSLAAHNIESRPFFYPLHTLPPYLSARTDSSLAVAERLGLNGISLPTWVGMNESHVERVCEAIQETLLRNRQAA